MASTDQLQFIAAKSIVVHPLVLLSIQDHAARVAKGTKKRVIGILLGQDLGPRGINVANSFAGQLRVL
jgi:26S proteasome regulatory subunit N8